MRPEELADVGQALYGDRWQSPLARDLHVTDRTVRRWVTGEFAIPAEAERGIRLALEGRLKTIGGMVKFSVNPRENIIFHFGTYACFCYDDSGEITRLSDGFAAPEQIPLITHGAKEALRQERERDPRTRVTWLDRTGRPPESVALDHGFLKGTVIIPPDIDLTEPVADEPFDAEDGVLHR